MPPNFKDISKSKLILKPLINTDSQSKLQQAISYHQKGQLAQAREIYEDVLKRQPKHFDALHLLGVIAYQTQHPQRAVELISRAIEIYPNNAAFYLNRGNALQEIKKFHESIASYEQAIVIKSNYALAHYNRGNVLQKLNRFDDAVVSYDRAIAIEPNYALAHFNRGNALQAMKQLKSAVASYDRAIAIKPDFAEAFFNRGSALKDLKQLEAAAASYSQVIAIAPNTEFVYGELLYTRMKLCAWTDLDINLNQLKSAIISGKRASAPLPVLALIDSPSVQKTTAKIWVQTRYPIGQIQDFTSRRSRQPKIRIGYYSADFRTHPVTHLMAKIFELHDKSKFELIAFSFGPVKKDEMRQRVAAAFDRFLDVSAISDLNVAQLSRSLEIDIAIDLMGFTQDGRTGIFTERCAPIQINYLGYPGTMGAPYIDYIVADKQLIPEQSQSSYSEKIAYLPDSYLPTSHQVDSARWKLANEAHTRSALGLPDSGFVFCCFNNNFKITPNRFDSWMRILKQVEDSVLWLFEENPVAAQNLQREAKLRGIDKHRLIFAKRVPQLSDHLSRYRAADLFLDTSPYNAHTTASDALWMGLPVLTCMGNSFASRVAGSLLNAMELRELITHTQQEYEATAIELATHPDKLSSIKIKLDKNRLTSPLFDSETYTRNLEKAYMAMYDRYYAGLSPEHIYIK